MQEADHKYNYEGWTRIYLACAGTDTQHLIDMLESMFGDGPKVDPEDLDTKGVKEIQAEAEKAEKEAAEQVGVSPGTGKNVIVTSLSITPKHGINIELIPELVTVRKWSVSKNKKVDKLYYKYKICELESQNCGSMLTHTRKCLKILLVCGVCNKPYQSLNYIENHIEKVHGNQKATQAQSGVEPGV